MPDGVTKGVRVCVARLVGVVDDVAKAVKVGVIVRVLVMVMLMVEVGEAVRGSSGVAVSVIVCVI